MLELKKTHAEVQQAYESAQDEGGLVSKIKTSTLPPSKQEILLALFEQGGRAIYEDIAPSFINLLEKPLDIYHNNLLFDSSLFLELIVASMEEIISQANDEGLKEYGRKFYAKIHTKIRRYLPSSTDAKVSEELKSLLEDFYNLYIRSTLSVARTKTSSEDNAQPNFTKDLAAVRQDMGHIYAALLQINPYQSIISNALEVLGRISVDYIDRTYPGESLQRTFLVNLHAGAYLLKYAAADHIKVESAAPEKVLPRHLERFRYEFP